MFMVTEADAAAIRTAFHEKGELSAVIELRRRFPGSPTCGGAGLRPDHRRLAPAATREAVLGGAAAPRQAPLAQPNTS